MTRMSCAAATCSGLPDQVFSVVDCGEAWQRQCTCQVRKTNAAGDADNNKVADAVWLICVAGGTQATRARRTKEEVVWQGSLAFRQQYSICTLHTPCLGCDVT